MSVLTESNNVRASQPPTYMVAGSVQLSKEWSCAVVRVHGDHDELAAAGQGWATFQSAPSAPVYGVYLGQQWAGALLARPDVRQVELRLAFDPQEVEGIKLVMNQPPVEAVPPVGEFTEDELGVFLRGALPAPDAWICAVTAEGLQWSAPRRRLLVQEGTLVSDFRPEAVLSESEGRSDGSTDSESDVDGFVVKTRRVDDAASTGAPTPYQHIKGLRASLELQEAAPTRGFATFRSFEAVNPRGIVADFPATAFSLAEPDVMKLSKAFLDFARTYTAHVFHSKGIVKVFRKHGVGQAERAATDLLKARFYAEEDNLPCVQGMEHEDEPLPAFLERIFQRVIAPRVGPVCSAKVKEFREDRSKSLYAVQEEFLRLARNAEDLTVRQAREAYRKGIVDDEAGRLLNSWLQERLRKGRHVSVEQMLEHHLELCKFHAGPQRLYPAQRSARVNFTQAAPKRGRDRVDDRACFYCSERGHLRAECPKRRQDEAMGKAPGPQRATVARMEVSRSGKGGRPRVRRGAVNRESGPNGRRPRSQPRTPSGGEEPPPGADDGIGLTV